MATLKDRKLQLEDFSKAEKTILDAIYKNVKQKKMSKRRFRLPKWHHPTKRHWEKAILVESAEEEDNEETDEYHLPLEHPGMNQVGRLISDYYLTSYNNQSSVAVDSFDNFLDKVVFKKGLIREMIIQNDFGEHQIRLEDVQPGKVKLSEQVCRNEGLTYLLPVHVNIVYKYVSNGSA